MAQSDFPKIPDQISIPAQGAPIEVHTGPFAGETFHIAPVLEIDDLAAEVNQILDALEEHCGILGAFVTDETDMSDFCFEDEDYSVLTRVLGVPVTERDSLVEVARRLRQKA